MARTGILRPEERIELIHGEILSTIPQGTPHAAFIDFLDTQLQRAFGEEVAVRTQLPFALGETSEPEPDLAVVPWSALRLCACSSHHCASHRGSGRDQVAL